MNANINSETLRRAADLQDEIEAKQNELAQLLSGQTVATSATVVTASGRKFSPEAIEKIRAAQRRRWKNIRKAKAAAAVQTAPAPAAVESAPAKVAVTA